MFHYRNGLLYADAKPQCLALKIPDGYWLETVPLGLCASMVSLRTPDKTASVEFGVDFAYAPSIVDEFLEYTDGEIEPSGPPQPIKFQGFDGFAYRIEQTFEIKLDITRLGITAPDGRVYTRLIQRVFVNQGPDVMDVVRKYDLDKILDQILVIE